MVLRPTTRFHGDPDSDDTEVKLHEFSSAKTLLLANIPEWRLVMHYGCVLKNGYSYTSAKARTITSMVRTTTQHTHSGQNLLDIGIRRVL